eukprot:CCRYP_017772-RA/>CCRYP_017772-RA protein AED:0.49 eAED:0.49 QI:0/-1/0/1/-1/1/1/0/100
MAGCSAESWAPLGCHDGESKALSWAGRRDRCLVATTGLPKAGCLAAAMAGCSAESWARRWAAMTASRSAELGWEEGPLLGCNDGPTEGRVLGCSDGWMLG